MSTPYHARYFAYELTRHRPSNGVDRLAASLFDACVDLNPHQIDAALFAVQSPLSSGVLLADEVGLGKTIEAGLVLCQFWAERKRRLLVVCPASLRKQWSLELEEKFNLPTSILDALTYRQLEGQGNPAPFLANRVVVTSTNFASAKQADLRATAWDLVVIDEAHKLRNAYRPSNRMGQRLRESLEGRRKLLLTATPLQNSLLELYGLSTVIDERLFGDLTEFRYQYMRQDSDLDELRYRLGRFCKRTLRNQVGQYVRYTERRAITRPFRPTDDEHGLYEAVSQFLKRENTFSIPTRQRTLTTLTLRKLLASSSSGIAGTLETMRDRLILLRDGLPSPAELAEQLIASEDMQDEYLDEAAAEADDSVEGTATEQSSEETDRARLLAEIAELDNYAEWARTIGVDTKSRALLAALQVGFSELERMGAPRKALVFTESRRTQAYLKAFLETNGYTGKVVLFNGTNGGPEARAVYDAWLAVNRETGRASGSRAIDIRTAIIEHFRDQAEVMIATEAGAEGVNLHFCSLVINYDLPWNPQRIEQRIGRCHRYGQQHDVVVVNFLNERNEADRRVLELLTEKFNLFSGVFGASDEVLGAIESGVDFEKRILAIYQECRSLAEIDAAFNRLRGEMDEVVKARLDDTRRALLEHFDEDVHARLRVQLDSAREHLDRVGRLFWALTRYVLREQADFDDQAFTFSLHTPPSPDVARGVYHLISKTQPNVAGDYLYRLSHPLGEYVVDTAREYPTPAAWLNLDSSHHPTRLADVEALRGQSGWLILERLTIDSFEQEEYLLFSAFADSGRSLDQETCERLFRCAGEARPLATVAPSAAERLRGDAERLARSTLAGSLERNNGFFQRERERLERWAEDMVAGVEKELAGTKAQIKTLNRQARLATTVEDQHEPQLRISGLEKQKRRQRQRIFDVEDEIKEKRDQLIEALEKRLQQRTERQPLFTIRWSVV